MRRKIIKRAIAIPLQNLSHLESSIVGLIPEIPRPDKKPPMWPKTSILFGPTEVKSIVKTINMKHRSINWHFKMGPILFNAVKFIAIYPIIIPRSP